MHELLGRELNIKTFNDFIHEQRRRNRTWKSAISMYNGDMWDGGRGYIGPLPLKKDDNASRILANIKRMFTFRNVIKEVVDRAVDGLLSKSPDWKIYDTTDILNSPRLRVQPRPTSDILPSTSFQSDGKKTTALTKKKTEKKNPKLSEAELILSEAWTSADLGGMLKKSVTQFMLEGKGKLRIYFSKKKLGTTDSLLEAVKHVKVQFVENEKATILDDGDEKLSIVEVTRSKSGEKLYEISFTDEDVTYVGSVNRDSLEGKHITEDTPIEQVSEEMRKVISKVVLSTPFSLDGALTIDEIKGDAFVTEAMLQNNRALNLNLSLAIGILIESGYAEMVTTNVALRTRQVPDPDNPGEFIEEEIGLERGPTTVNNLIGEQTVDAQGRKYYEQPQVFWKEPSKIDTSLQGDDLFYRNILKEAKQEFVINNADNEISGESRVQSRQDFVKMEMRYKPKVDIHGGWLLNTFLRAVATVAGKDGYFDEVGIIFDSKVSAGELSADEKNVVISRYTAGLVSRETAMVLLGEEDPLIEIDKIRADDEEKLQNQIRRLEETAKFGNMAENGTPRELPDGRTKSRSPNDQRAKQEQAKK